MQKMRIWKSQRFSLFRLNNHSFRPCPEAQSIHSDFSKQTKKKNNLDFSTGSMRLRRKNETTVGRRQGLIQETVVLCGGKSAYGVAYHFAAVSVHGLRSPLRGVFHRHSAAFCFVNAECSILLEALCFA